MNSDFMIPESFEIVVMLFSVSISSSSEEKKWKVSSTGYSRLENLAGSITGSSLA